MVPAECLHRVGTRASFGDLLMVKRSFKNEQFRHRQGLRCPRSFCAFLEIPTFFFNLFSFFSILVVSFLSFNVPGLLDCVHYDGMALHFLLPLLHYDA